ncbi:alpha/beta fold hydrolase [Motiliproteus sp. SC1-56]|uniref:alpha/beta fold hydrolase n=1 Tax=Motiliproteus sp. SC1-56 TaxID=2799565 RepID=UPI001A8E2CC3|nr:alpha/beta fold hydrolase [Motiliproteus sp. SC1-56]
MPPPDDATVRTRDMYIEHPHGRLFARIWEPRETPAAATRAPIILFHDSLGCVALWRSFPARLSTATGRRVVAYDRLGFGRSDAREDKPTLDFVADEARTYFPAVLEQLGGGPFIALGHSVGGGMAIHCAAAYADQCLALITEAAQVFAEDLTLESIAAAKVQFREPGQVERLQRYHGDKAQWVLDAWTDTWLHPEFRHWTLTPVLPRVRCPVLAIHGAHDEYGSRRHPEMIAELSAGPSRCEILPGTYHVPHREDEAAIASRVCEFIDSINARPLENRLAVP